MESNQNRYVQLTRQVPEHTPFKVIQQGWVNFVGHSDGLAIAKIIILGQSSSGDSHDPHWVLAPKFSCRLESPDQTTLAFLERR